MLVNTKFSVATHILAFLEMNRANKPSSELLAGSVNTNASYIRKIMGLLKQANLITSSQGIANTSLTRKPEKITLLDIYKAVTTEKDQPLFHVHMDANLACPVGKNIEPTLTPLFNEIQTKFEKELDQKNLADVMISLTEKIN